MNNLILHLRLREGLPYQCIDKIIREVYAEKHKRMIEELKTNISYHTDMLLPENEHNNFFNGLTAISLGEYSDSHSDYSDEYWTRKKKSILIHLRVIPEESIKKILTYSQSRHKLKYGYIHVLNQIIDFLESVA